MIARFDLFSKAVQAAIENFHKTGTLGHLQADGSRVITVPGRDHFVFVQTGAGDTTGIVEAFNAHAPRKAGARVRIVKVARTWVILGIDESAGVVDADTFNVAYHVHAARTGLPQSVNDLDGMPHTLAGGAGQVLTVNDDEDGYYLADAASGGGGATSFVDLDDVPTSYSGQGGKLLAVKAAADGVEFVASSSSGVTFDDLLALGVVSLADKVPASPDTDNDEFDDATVAVAWTQYGDGGVISAVVSEDTDGKLRIAMPANSGVEVNTFAKTVPTGDFTMTAKLCALTGYRLNYNRPAFIAVMKGTHTDNVLMFGPGLWTPIMAAEQFPTFGTSSGATIYSNQNWNVILPLYLKFERSGTTWLGYWSGDGANFVQHFSIAEPWTIARIGLGIMPQNGAYGVNATWDWVRFNWTIGD